MLVPREHAEGGVQIERHPLDERGLDLHAIEREPLALGEQLELSRLEPLEGARQLVGPGVAPRYEGRRRLDPSTSAPGDAGQGTDQGHHDRAEHPEAVPAAARRMASRLEQRRLEAGHVGLGREVQVGDALGRRPGVGRGPACPGALVRPGGEAREPGRSRFEVAPNPGDLTVLARGGHALAYARRVAEFPAFHTRRTPEPTLRYLSTRGHGPVGLVDALLAGPAPDGGLYLPEHLEPPRTGSIEAQPEGLARVAAAVLAPYLAPDVAGARLERLLADALDFEVPSVAIAPDTELLDLTLGPSGAFKDVAARVLARLLAEVPLPGDGRRTVLVATSGDTGGAVARAFEGLETMHVVVLFPERGVSAVQRRVFTAASDNVTAIAVRGDFDACQRIAREALADPALRERYGLTSANSLNIGRLLPQMAYYHLAAGRAADAGRGAPTFVVPSGNLGNLTAGFMARRSGLAAAGFVAALNANDAFARFLDERPGDEGETTVRTLSNAMDVGRPSNLERLAALAGGDRDALGREIVAVSIDDEATRRTMRRTWSEHGRLVDPHTAVGLAALERARADGVVEGPAIVLSTAHPGKFPEIVRDVTGVEPPPPPGMKDLASREERWLEADATLEAVVSQFPRFPRSARVGP